MINAICETKYMSFSMFNDFYDRIQRQADSMRFNGMMNSMISTDSEAGKVSSIGPADYLWFVLNPEKTKEVRRRTVRDFMRLIWENRDGSRKKILEALEGFVKNLNGSDEEFQY